MATAAIVALLVWAVAGPAVAAHRSDVARERREVALCADLAAAQARWRDLWEQCEWLPPLPDWLADADTEAIPLPTGAHGLEVGEWPDPTEGPLRPLDPAPAAIPIEPATGALPATTATLALRGDLTALRAVFGGAA